MASRLEDALLLALELSPLDKVRLMEQVASTLEHELAGNDVKPLPSLYGSLADLGKAPSAEEIDEVRREIFNKVIR